MNDSVTVPGDKQRAVCSVNRYSARDGTADTGVLSICSEAIV